MVRFTPLFQQCRACIKLDIIELTFLSVRAAPPRPAHRGTGPPDAGGAQEWRDPQWTPRYMRYVDEPHAEGGGADQPGTLHLLSALFLPPCCAVDAPMRQRPGCVKSNVREYRLMLGLSGWGQIFQVTRGVCEGQ